ncbi:MAG: LysR family transcriptional regulator [Ruminococcaceae bacterium]|nr:LysR family transcriptional regulator [Oscillospiraceae bacterium]
MELTQKYAYAVWENKSFSKAAKALFISQPSLSATVAKLENELGFKIFDRSTHPISLTTKGTVYINYLRETEALENLLAHQLKASDDLSAGSLTVGGRMSSSYCILPIICGEFLKKHPNISIIVDIEAGEEKLKSQSLDLMLSVVPQTTEYATIPLLEERLIVVLHKRHPMARSLADLAVPYQDIVSQNIAPEREITDISVFSEVPFIITGRSSDSDRRLAMMMKNYKTSPCIVINAKNVDIRYRIMKEGLGAVLVPDIFLSNFAQDSDELYYFALRSPYTYRTLYIQHQKNLSENKLLDTFIETMLKVCQDKKGLLQRN